MKGTKRIPFIAAAFAALLPASAFAAGTLDGASEQAAADAKWMDGARISAHPTAAAAGADKLSGVSPLSGLTKPEAAASAGSPNVPSPTASAKGPRTIDQAIQDRDDAGRRWVNTLDWHADWKAGEGLGRSLGRAAKSLLAPFVMGYGIMLEGALMGYRKYGLPGAAAAGVAMLAIGTVIGALNTAVGVIGNLATAGKSVYKSLDRGFRSLFGIAG